MKELNSNNKNKTRLRTLSSSPPSPSSSSSSDFEFIVTLSPTSRKSSSLLCPADELFYKGQLLPLHLSPRLSMVRTLLASSSSSSSDTATGSRDSTASSASSYDLSLDSARPSSAADDDDLKKPTFHHPSKKSKYFSFSKISSVFLRKDNANPPRPTSENSNSPSSSKRITASAREVIRKYMKKVKPLYEKFTPKQSKMAGADPPLMVRTAAVGCNITRYGKSENYSHSSFSGNLRYPRRRSCVVSCPSSPTHSGVLRGGGGMYANSSSMEELQSAIEGAITHCKRSMNEFGEKKGSVHVADVDGQ